MASARSVALESLELISAGLNSQASSVDSSERRCKLSPGPTVDDRNPASPYIGIHEFYYQNSYTFGI